MKEATMVSKLRLLKESARKLRTLSTRQKNQVLKNASRLLRERQNEVLKANAKDLARIQKNDVTSAFVDRLTLNPDRIRQMSESLKQVAALPDPVGEVVERKKLKNGLE